MHMALGTQEADSNQTDTYYVTFFKAEHQQNYKRSMSEYDISQANTSPLHFIRVDVVAGSAQYTGPQTERSSSVPKDKDRNTAAVLVQQRSSSLQPPQHPQHDAKAQVSLTRKKHTVTKPPRR